MRTKNQQQEQYLAYLEDLGPENRTVEQAATLELHRKVRLLISAFFEILTAGTVALALILGAMFYQSYEGRVRIVSQARIACFNLVLATGDDIAGLKRSAENWTGAARARRADGDTAVADTYAKNAREDRQDADRARARLIGADEGILRIRKPDGRPAPVAVAEAKAACKRRWPDASIIPWDQPTPRNE